MDQAERRDPTDSVPAPPAEPARPWTAIDPELARRAASLPGFQRFRPARHAGRSGSAVAPLGTEPASSDDADATEAPAIAPAPQAPEASADPVPRETAPGDAALTDSLSANPDTGDAGAAPLPTEAYTPLDLTGIETNLRRIADILDDRLGELAARPHRLRELGVAPRVPVRREIDGDTLPVSTGADDLEAERLVPDADDGSLAPSRHATFEDVTSMPSAEPDEAVPLPRPTADQTSAATSWIPDGTAPRRRGLKIVDAILVVALIAVLALWAFLLAGGDLRSVPLLREFLPATPRG